LCNPNFGEKLGEFGMIGVDVRYLGMKIMKSLIDASEARCKSKGCKNMQLELLYPKDWEHP